MGDLETLAKQAFATVTAVSNDPWARYTLRERFYEKYGYGDDGGAGYGNSELAFLRWEIARGVYRFTLTQSIEPGEYAFGYAHAEELLRVIWVGYWLRRIRPISSASGC